MELNPQVSVLLLLKPDWDSAEDGFSEQWDQFLGHREEVTGQVEKDAIFEDRSLALLARDTASGLALAEQLKEALIRRLATPFPPVFFAVDAGRYLKEDGLCLDTVQIPWTGMQPGSVFVSPSAKQLLNAETEGITFVQGQGAAKSFSKVIPQRKTDQLKPLLEVHGHVTAGKNPPCFYCSSRRHRVSDCPSKRIVVSLKEVDGLGYLSVEELIRAFLLIVQEPDSHTRQKQEGPEAGQGQALSTARRGYYGLKRVYQIPFFKNLWDAKEDSWEKIRKSSPKKETKGGSVWMGTDCLRVSNWSQAEAYLRQATEKHGDDYRPYCALGFLHLEKSDFLGARHSFIKAVDRAQTNPQKVLVNLLIARLYDLENYPTEAAERVREALKLDPNCAEAHYQDVVLRFKDGRGSEALSRLVKLIERDRTFFIHALIDPDLAPFAEVIHPQLNELYGKAREEAGETVFSARRELKKAKLLLGDKETQDADSPWSRIGEMAKGEGYFAYLDIAQHGKAVIAASRQRIQIRKRDLLEKLYQLSQRVERCSEFIRKYRYPGLAGSVQGQLVKMVRNIMETKEMANSDVPQKFRDSFDRPALMVEEMAKIESSLNRLDVIQRTALFLGTFGKAWLILQAVVVLVAIVLFPVAVHYLNLILPKYGMDRIGNPWPYQQGILIVGGLAAVSLASFKAFRRARKGVRLDGRRKTEADDPAFSMERGAPVSHRALGHP